MTDLPKPLSAQICSVCKIDWSKHVDRYDKRRRRWDLYEKFKDDPYEDEPDEPLHPIDLQDCVALLLVVNQGPMGYQGPKGDTGEGVTRITS